MAPPLQQTFPLANRVTRMASHWIYTLGAKACAWSGALTANFWPQTPCNVDETWNMGYVVVGAFALLALHAVYRRANAWHNYYRR